ncbi:ABC transporter family substrate-binding protein [Brevibacterium sp. 5221]|uniref:ABC transporter family substrate-binding protein n=1 Tax=Brevibacterium rongguiense TaxID=2695267 RepID=A0A6N9H6K9_9MICO|nr:MULTISPECIES: ABC transporter family substrate-binding protein [Brevibacterium]MYM19747.1 ABC transporter family substrate-binding protein [Brevibacterium rongguiense]WAL40466.1 ABC transporter family substrate-binding protein [Brevibacterium sp. BRM-1]
MKKHLLTAGAGVLATAMLLSACSPNNGADSSDEGGSGNQDAEVKVMWNQPFFSMNNESNTGNATANSNLVYMMNDSFKYYDPDLKLQENEGFGKIEKVSDDPLKVKYTIGDKAKWSDGTPYSAADLVLAWGARSGNFNTKDADKASDDEGNVKKQKGENVVFNAADPQVARIKDFPEISSDNKEVTFSYPKPFADWEANLALTDGGLPAHIVAKKALGTDDAQKGNDAVLKAFKDKDNKSLTKIANTWNTGFDFTKLPSDKDLLVTTGPYEMTEYKENQYVTLTRRDNYEGDRKPNIKKVTVRYNEDPTAAVQALQNGEVDAIQPQATADILKQVQGIDGVKTDTGDDATYEHVDLAMANGGPFDPKTYGGDAAKAKKVRQAFLKAMPREKIVNDIIKPLNDSAKVRNSFIQVPGSPSYDQIVKENGIEQMYGQQDLEGAKKLLQEASASKPKVRVMYAKDNARRQQEFQLIKEAGDQAGFEVVDGGDAQWSEHLPDTSRYDASLFGWQSTSTTVTESEANFTSTGQNNFGKYSNKDVDKLYDQLGQELDTGKQAELEGQIEKHLVDDAFGITLFQFPSITSYREQLSGIDNITVAPTLFWNYYEWKMQ